MNQYGAFRRPAVACPRLRAYPPRSPPRRRGAALDYYFLSCGKRNYLVGLGRKRQWVTEVLLLQVKKKTILFLHHSKND